MVLIAEIPKMQKRTLEKHQRNLQIRKANIEKALKKLTAKYTRYDYVGIKIDCVGVKMGVDLHAKNIVKILESQNTEYTLILIEISKELNLRK